VPGAILVAPVSKCARAGLDLGRRARAPKHAGGANPLHEAFSGPERCGNPLAFVLRIEEQEIEENAPRQRWRQIFKTCP
jgi:hypothetical protein